MKLIDVTSATATAIAGRTDFMLVVTYDDEGGGDRVTDLPFTLDAGDWEDMSDQVTAWMAAHPDFEVAPYVAPAPTGDMVDAERERRIALPLAVTLSVGNITINMDDKAQRNLQGLASTGMYLVGAAPSQTTTFRDYANASHDLLPSDLVAMGLQVAQRIQAVYTASWAVKALEPIPTDYADDSRWP